MEIKIIGGNSPERNKLLKNITKAGRKINESIEINLLESVNDIVKYGLDTPGLIINEKFVSQGKILTIDEILNYMNSLN